MKYFKTCHGSGGVEYKQTHTESSNGNRKGNAQNLLRVIYVCTADVTDGRMHTYVIVTVAAVRMWGWMWPWGGYVSVLLPSFLLITEPTGARILLCGNLVWQMWSECLIMALICCNLIAFPSGCHLWGYPVSNVSFWVEMGQIISGGSRAHRLAGPCRHRVLPHFTPTKAHLKDFSSCNQAKPRYLSVCRLPCMGWDTQSVGSGPRKPQQVSMRWRGQPNQMRAYWLELTTFKAKECTI